MGVGGFGSTREARAYPLFHNLNLCGGNVAACGSRHPSSWFEYIEKQEASVLETIDFKRQLLTMEKQLSAEHGASAEGLSTSGWPIVMSSG